MCLLCVSLAVSLARGAEPSPPAAPAVLHLTNGGYASGELKNSGGPSRLGWQSPLFTAPFDFDVNLVSAVHFPLPEQLPSAVGEYRFELSQGDVLFGSLASWNGETVELDVPKIGRVTARASDLARLSRWRDSAGLVYLGPNGMAGWRAPAADSGWREEFGHLATSQDFASLRSRFDLPARAIVEFEISWKKRPAFVLALGAGDDEKQFQQAWRFEVWDGELTIHRETDSANDLATLQKVVSAEGRAHFQVYLDQDEGRCLVYSAAGEKLADLTNNEAPPGAPAGMRIENKHGDLRLERLRVAHWAGALPREVETQKPRVHRTDGSIVYGRVAGFNPAAREFVVRDGKVETRIAAGDVDLAVMSSSGDAEPRAIRASYQDGTQVSGGLAKVEAGAVWLTTPGTREPLRLPIDGLRSLVVLRHQEPVAPADAGPTGMLEADGVRLRGRLVDARPSAAGSCLVWQPLESAAAAPLRTGISAKIVYRETPPPPTRQPGTAGQAKNGRMMIAIAGNGVVVKQGGAAPVIAGGMPPAAPQVARNTPRVAGAGAADLELGGVRALHLRSGDTIPCEVTGIDENGILFRTPLSDATFIPHARIKAVDLVGGQPRSSAVRLNKIKRERLLTLPRMQRESPPTHLIRSKNGDFLRGRVVAMDEKKLTVETRLENRAIPRERIAQIIWLHADELGDGAAAPPPEAKPAGEKARAQWNPVEERPGVKQTAVEERIVRSLDKPTTVEFLDLPLEDCLTFLKEYHNLNLVIDRAALSEQGVPLDKPITLKLAGVVLRSVLKLILEPLQLTYVVEDDALKITAAADDDFPDEVAVKQQPGKAPPAEQANGMRVHVLRSDRNRLTFFAEKLTDNVLFGKSDVLGACRVDLNAVDQLLVGEAIEEAAALLTYHRWKLHHAIEPKTADDAGEDGSTGTESALVGKPAPAFELDLLNGKRFRLAETRGRVIVLDFWATWCGPCIQAMPQVDRTVREFADQGVQLIAVNIEETPKQITALLNRHKLELTVALDRDGVVAGRYGATAIPQTVIIDRDGNVARVFVGGGPHVGEQLADALRKVLDPGNGEAPKGD
jgi:peroxiredoxin